MRIRLHFCTHFVLDDARDAARPCARRRGSAALTDCERSSTDSGADGRGEAAPAPPSARPSQRDSSPQRMGALLLSSFASCPPPPACSCTLSRVGSTRPPLPPLSPLAPPFSLEASACLGGSPAFSLFDDSWMFLDVLCVKTIAHLKAAVLNDLAHARLAPRAIGVERPTPSVLSSLARGPAALVLRLENAVLPESQPIQVLEKGDVVTVCMYSALPATQLAALAGPRGAREGAGFSRTLAEVHDAGAERPVLSAEKKKRGRSPPRLISEHETFCSRASTSADRSRETKRGKRATSAGKTHARAGGLASQAARRCRETPTTNSSSDSNSEGESDAGDKEDSLQSRAAQVARKKPLPAASAAKTAGASRLGAAAACGALTGAPQKKPIVAYTSSDDSSSDDSSSDDSSSDDSSRDESSRDESSRNESSRNESSRGAGKPSASFSASSVAPASRQKAGAVAGTARASGASKSASQLSRESDWSSDDSETESSDEDRPAAKSRSACEGRVGRMPAVLQRAMGLAPTAGGLPPPAPPVRRLPLNRAPQPGHPPVQRSHPVRRGRVKTRALQPWLRLRFLTLEGFTPSVSAERLVRVEETDLSTKRLRLWEHRGPPHDTNNKPSKLATGGRRGGGGGSWRDWESLTGIRILKEELRDAAPAQTNGAYQASAAPASGTGAALKYQPRRLLALQKQSDEALADVGLAAREAAAENGSATCATEATRAAQADGAAAERRSQSAPSPADKTAAASPPRRAAEGEGETRWESFLLAKMEVFVSEDGSELLVRHPAAAGAFFLPLPRDLLEVCKRKQKPRSPSAAATAGSPAGLNGGADVLVQLVSPRAEGAEYAQAESNGAEGTSKDEGLVVDLAAVDVCVQNCALRILKEKLTQSRNALRRQFDFYFSPANWEKDAHLRSVAVPLPAALARKVMLRRQENKKTDEKAAQTAGEAAGDGGSEKAKKASASASSTSGDAAAPVSGVPLRDVAAFPRVFALTRDLDFIAESLLCRGGLQFVSAEQDDAGEWFLVRTQKAEEKDRVVAAAAQAEAGKEEGTADSAGARKTKSERRTRSGRRWAAAMGVVGRP
ncbi:hypothetical protein BESB_000670 [Besnoitia besnoiti]|uniref:HTH La-type RNA-binding domain-containing protein n=1 Tax=Besnoitia besnoiti TaxID=94643 RepID=A0A2A9MIB3_BESBE|nr:hypothetical protein BESB_000670 [Besnoitia besnoiti]PFH37725.1 hypothetical protein BESB_000670 [Besnoitia besnoiti]